MEPYVIEEFDINYDADSDGCDDGSTTGHHQGPCYPAWRSFSCCLLNLSRYIEQCKNIVFPGCC